MKKQGLPRRFIGKHPIWGETKRTQAVDGSIKPTMMGVPWKESPYYWWWYALRLNADYEKVCKAKGKTSNRKLARLYKDFGDVHTGGFKEWWRQGARGAELFAEPPAPLRVKTLEASELKDYEEVIEGKQAIVVAIPLSLTKREIASALKKEVAKVHRGGTRGFHALKSRQADSEAKYTLSPYKDIASLKDALKAVEMRRKGKRLLDIAYEFERIRKSEERGRARGNEDYWIQESNISRMVKQGECIITNTANGLFPLRAIPKKKAPKKN